MISLVCVICKNSIEILYGPDNYKILKLKEDGKCGIICKDCLNIEQGIKWAVDKTVDEIVQVEAK